MRWKNAEVLLRIPNHRFESARRLGEGRVLGACDFEGEAWALCLFRHSLRISELANIGVYKACTAEICGDCIGG